MTTFISYSRVNSEFVVRLARDLKAAGFDVWLDQLDIPKGARWDDAIEAAVERSSTFMIVLAPESIESQNVKDELSYAIDSGKRILPVVIRPCKIPLRLRRFQYVDFTDKPYNESLADIKRLLGNTQRITAAHPEEPIYEPGEPSAVVTGPLLAHKTDAPFESPAKDEREQKNAARRFLVPAALALLTLAVAGTAVFALNRKTPPPPPILTPTSTITLLPATLTPTRTPIPLEPEIVDRRQVSMRLVSAGDFIMGSNDGPADEQPAEILFLDDFYIDKYEVTNRLYKVCVQAGACQPPEIPNTMTPAGYYTKPEFDSYPVVYVDWNMARTYCEWRGARLPTEAEWEKAARGPEGNIYPWGEGISCAEANYSGCQDSMVPVSADANGLSEYGVYSLAGNVSEWVSSLHKKYPYKLFDGREDLEAPGPRVIRGGSWVESDGEDQLRAAHREPADPSTAAENIGFRCVLVPDGSIADIAAIVDTPSNGRTATSIAATKRFVKKEKEDESSSPAQVTSSARPVTLTSSVDADTLTPRPTTVTPELVVTTDTPEGVPTTMTPEETEPPTEPPTDPPTEPPTEAPTDAPAALPGPVEPSTEASALP